jgi:hypothetical protein
MLHVYLVKYGRAALEMNWRNGPKAGSADQRGHGADRSAQRTNLVRNEPDFDDDR